MGIGVWIVHIFYKLFHLSYEDDSVECTLQIGQFMKAFLIDTNNVTQLLVHTKILKLYKLSVEKVSHSYSSHFTSYRIAFVPGMLLIQLF